MPATRGAGPSLAKPPPPASTASSSSLSSGRQDRNARLSTAKKSATPQSRSSEEMSEPPRRSQRSHPTKKDDANKDEHDVEEEAIEDEEEVTRCICGQQDYPGPALSEAFNTGVAPSEDAGGLFISCDGCSVWQHGGCVGIFEESQVPDKYYCEECKPKLHELHVDARGQNYSLYQPVYAKSSRKPSVSKHGDKTKQDQELAALRASTDPATGKRRATMRSKEHDDEEEQMRRAIEESKRELGGSSNGNGRRNGKRSREDSEDQKIEVKRPRRASELVPPGSKAVATAEDSDDESTSVHVSKGKKARADAVQSVRQAELREKEKEREKARAEAAGRRQERAGRRRADDEPEEETPRPSTSAKASPPPSSQAESPQPDGPSERAPLKKGPGKRVKKLGNNQWTKLRGAPTSSPPNGKKSQSNSNGQGSSSGDEGLANGDGHPKSSGTNKNSPERITGPKGKFGKGKNKVNGNSSKSDDPTDLTMATMKRRMEAMAAFIAKAKVELKGDRTPLGGAASGATPKASTEEASSGDGVQASSSDVTIELANVQSLEEMNAMQLAEVVSGRIAEWQQRFGNVT